MHRYVLALLIVASPFSALAGELPKEGNFDYTVCWSGAATNVITFSKTLSATVWEDTGTLRSNPPGGLFDKNTFRCVGLTASFDGKITNTRVCESIDADGDKRLTREELTADGKDTQTRVAGTGKYEGFVTTRTVEQLGSFPAIKDGTFQGCNRATGTYKLK